MDDKSIMDDKGIKEFVDSLLDTSEKLGWGNYIYAPYKPFKLGIGKEMWGVDKIDG